jgi:hypothetical protein
VAGATGGETNAGGTAIGAVVFTLGAGFGAGVAVVGLGSRLGATDLSTLGASTFLGASKALFAFGGDSAVGIGAAIGPDAVFAAVFAGVVNGGATDTSPASGTVGVSTFGATGAAVVGFPARDVSISAGLRLTEASAAIPMDRATNTVAKMVVVRVKKFDAPRADIKPAGLPPPAKPPPSDCCIRMTATSAAAIIA